MEELALADAAFALSSAYTPALAKYSLTSGDGFIWAAGEGALAREVYTRAVKERGYPAEWVKTAEYWVRNV